MDILDHERGDSHACRLCGEVDGNVGEVLREIATPLGNAGHRPIHAGDVSREVRRHCHGVSNGWFDARVEEMQALSWRGACRLSLGDDLLTPFFYFFDGRLHLEAPVEGEGEFHSQVGYGVCGGDVLRILGADADLAKLVGKHMGVARVVGVGFMEDPGNLALLGVEREAGPCAVGVHLVALGREVFNRVGDSRGVIGVA